MALLKVPFVGAGSPFAARMAVDLLRSEPLKDHRVRFVMMDTDRDAAEAMTDFARQAAERLGETPHKFDPITDLVAAIDSADFVLCAAERDRTLTWRQDFNVPLRHGIKQSLGECGGPGGLFHYLRNLGVVLELAYAMEKRCLAAPLLCFTNPENRIPYAVNRASSVTAYGFCHGVFMGAENVAGLLDCPASSLELTAAGLNHFTWFTSIKDRTTGLDLYPRLRERDREVPLERGPVLDRVLFRRFGLWPSPGGDHSAEYISWAAGMSTPPPWLWHDALHPDAESRAERGAAHSAEDIVERLGGWEAALAGSGELAIPVIEGIACGVKRRLDAVIVRNEGAIANLPDDAAVEVPAQVDVDGIRPERIGELPEAVAAMCRTQVSIHKLGLQAYLQRRKDLLLQAVLIDPVVNDYDAAVATVEELLELQSDYLPEFE